MATWDDLKSISEEIQRLARLTGAPPSFVEQMREFFDAKKIPMTQNAEPYYAALEQAFLLEESVRRNMVRARENLIRLQDCMRLVGATYQQQLGQLKRVRDSLEQQGRLVREGAQRLKELGRSATQQQTRTLLGAPKGTFLVPGPTELQ